MIRLLHRLAAWLPWACGRIQPPTLMEEKRRAFGHLPVAYRQTQPAHFWKLRVSRRLWRGRKAGR